MGEYLNVELNQIIKVLELKSLACNDKRKENELFEFYWGVLNFGLYIDLISTELRI